MRSPGPDINITFRYDLALAIAAQARRTLSDAMADRSAAEGAISLVRSGACGSVGAETETVLAYGMLLPAAFAAAPSCGARVINKTKIRIMQSAARILT